MWANFECNLVSIIGIGEIFAVDHDAGDGASQWRALDGNGLVLDGGDSEKRRAWQVGQKQSFTDAWEDRKRESSDAIRFPVWMLFDYQYWITHSANGYRRFLKSRVIRHPNPHFASVAARRLRGKWVPSQQPSAGEMLLLACAEGRERRWSCAYAP